MDTVKGRLLLLQAGLILIFILGVVLVHQMETSPVSLLQSDSILRSTNLVKRIREQQSQTQNAFVYDYSYWDEMAEAIRTKDTAWCRDYLPPAMQTFNSDMVWVCDTAFRVLFSYNRKSADQKGPALPVPVDSAAGLFSRAQFPHYFTYLDSNLVEVSLAGVQLISDSLRENAPSGYFVVGHVWDESHIQENSLKCEAELSVVDVEASLAQWESEPWHGILRFTDTLADWHGQPMAVVRAEAFSRSMLELARARDSRIYILSGLALILVFFWWFSLKRFVLKPLRKISDALQTESVEPIEQMRDENNEFGVVARLVKWYFDQREELKNEIRDHLMAEGTLQASFEHLESVTQELNLVLANTADFIYRQDIYGNLTYLTPSVTEITGYSIDEFKTHYTLLLTDNPINQDVIKNTEYALMSGKMVPPYRAEIYHKDRRRLMLEINERPLLANGVVSGIIGVARDITEQVEHERQRELLTQQVQRAERMETLAMLAGGVAHDLNNTLGPLVAYPEMMVAALGEESEFKEELEEMQRSATQAAHIVQDLLSMARRGRYRMAPLDLCEVVKAYLSSASFRDLSQRFPNTRLECDLVSGGAMLLGSSHHLQTALMNLVTNAFEAMSDKPGSELRLSCIVEDDLLCHAAHRPDHTETICLRITDNGPGIPEELIGKVLEPYFSTKQLGKSGSGLGLAVVNGIISDHAGCLAIHSSIGSGTTFEIHLPGTQEQGEVLTTLPDEVTGIESVLVLDDMADQGTVMSRILRGFGYDVHACTRLAEAAELMRRQKFQVAILDMLLGDEYDGLDALRELRSIEPELCIVVVSGYAFTQRVQEILDTGNAEFLPKPVSARDLGAMVRSVLARRRLSATLTTPD